MRLWIDDTHPAPTGFVHIKTVKAAKAAIRCYERTFSGEDTIVISIGNDVEILKWLEETKFVDTGYFFHFHSKNIIGAKIIEKNGWREIHSLEVIQNGAISCDEER